MVAKPMQGDGPATDIYEDDPPYTFEELVATSDGNLDLMHALSMARNRDEFTPDWALEPWQRIGPDILWMVHRGDMSVARKVLNETYDYVAGLRWVRQKKLSHQQIDRAVIDAVNKLGINQCLPAEIASLAVALRKDTYLDLRAEATAFMVNCMAVAQFGTEVALGRRPEPDSSSKGHN